MSAKADHLTVVSDAANPGLEVVAALYVDPYLLDGQLFAFDGSQLDQPYARIVSTMLREREKLLDQTGCFDVKLILSALEQDGPVRQDTQDAVMMADTHSDPIVAVKLAAKAREKQLHQVLSELAKDLLESPGSKKLQASKLNLDQEVTECRAVIEGDQWDAPIDVGRIDLPEFPIDALPDPLRDLCEEVANNVDTSPGLVACAGLGVLSTLTCGRVAVEMSDSWKVPVALYTVALAPSGGGKGPAFGIATEPLRKVQDELRDQELDSVNRELANYEIAEEKAKQLAKEASKAKGPDAEVVRIEALEAAEYFGRMQKPQLPRYFVNDDFTEAALANAIAANDQRLGIISDEARTLFDSLSGRHSASGSPEARILISGYAGESAGQLRAGRGEVNLDHPQLSVSVALQPDTFEKFLRNDDLADAGLFNRFLIARIDWNQDFDKLPSGEVKRAVRAKWDLMVRQLAKLPDQGANGWELGFTPIARQMLDELRTKFRQHQKADGFFARYPGYATKFDQNLIRIVGVLHMAECAANDECERFDQWTAIEPETVERAGLIADYFAAHAVGTLSAAGISEEERGAAIVRERINAWLADPKTAADKFTRKSGRTFLDLRTLQRDATGDRRTMRTRGDLIKACEVLVERDWLREAKRPIPGRGPAGTWYELHPIAFS